jgi:hypothetical protein
VTRSESAIFDLPNKVPHQALLCILHAHRLNCDNAWSLQGLGNECYPYGFLIPGFNNLRQLRIFSGVYAFARTSELGVGKTYVMKTLMPPAKSPFLITRNALAGGPWTMNGDDMGYKPDVFNKICEDYLRDLIEIPVQLATRGHKAVIALDILLDCVQVAFR